MSARNHYAERGYKIFRGALQVEAVDAAAREARRVDGRPSGDSGW